VKLLFIIFGILLLLLLFNCVSSGESKKVESKREFDIYIASVKTTERKDVYAIGIEKDVEKGMYSFSQDRYEGSKSILMKLEFGVFVKEGNTYTFTPKEGEPYKAVMTAKGLELNGLIYKLSKPKEE